DSMRQFIRMYNPHEAREDTILCSAFRGIVSAHEFDSLGEDFEKKEDELFGEDGFFKVVDHVAEIEKKLGIYDLAQFTPNTLGNSFAPAATRQRDAHWKCAVFTLEVRFDGGRSRDTNDYIAKRSAKERSGCYG